MHAGNVTDTLKLALEASGCSSASVVHKPKLLSGNGPSHIAEELAEWVGVFIDHYNHRRYHESLGAVTPAYTYFGRAQAIIKQRARIKRKVIQRRRLQRRKLAT